MTDITMARPARPPRFGVLLSGTGRTLENFLAQIAEGRLSGQIVGVVSSLPDVRGLDIAATAGIPSTVIHRRAYASDNEYSDAIYAWLTPLAPDLVLLAG